MCSKRLLGALVLASAILGHGALAQDCESALRVARLEKSSSYKEENFEQDLSRVRQRLFHDGFVGIPLEVAAIRIKGVWDGRSLRETLRSRAFLKQNREYLKRLDDQALDIYQACLGAQTTGLRYAAALFEDDRAEQEFKVVVRFDSPAPNRMRHVSARLVVDGAECRPLGGGPMPERFQVDTAAAAQEFLCQWLDGKSAASVQLNADDWLPIPRDSIAVPRPTSAQWLPTLGGAGYKDLPYTSETQPTDVCQRYLVDPSTGAGVKWNQARSASWSVLVQARHGGTSAADPMVYLGSENIESGESSWVPIGTLSNLKARPDGYQMGERRLTDQEILVLRIGESAFGSELILYEPAEAVRNACAARGGSLSITARGNPVLRIQG